jgi:hypothetical protein
MLVLDEDDNDTIIWLQIILCNRYIISKKRNKKSFSQQVVLEKKSILVRDCIKN